jgi:Transcriptional regulators
MYKRCYFSDNTSFYLVGFNVGGTNLAQSAISSIRSYYPNLSKLHQKIADYIFAQPQMVSDLTINELAEKVGVSTASISRLLRLLAIPTFVNSVLIWLTSRQMLITAVCLKKSILTIRLKK